MGTSKSRINQKAKKLLEEIGQNNPSQDIPEIIQIVINKKELEKDLDEEKLSTSFELIATHFKKLSEEGFNGKKFDELKDDTITKQEFIESVIEEIEKYYDLDGSKAKLIKKAFKQAMVKILLSNFNLVILAELFFYNFIFSLLERELLDTIKTHFESISTKKIKEKLKEITDNIFGKEVEKLISSFMEKKSSLDDVLTTIERAVKALKLGEF